MKVMATTDKKPRIDDLEMKFNWKPQPILAEDIIQQPVLEKAYVGILKEKQGISKAIASLANCLPSPQYLKRCSGLKIYLATVEKMKGNPENLKEFLKQNKFDLSLLEEKFEIVEVSAAAPKTKAQMSYVSKFWPVNFHPDLNLESLISGSIFNDDQLASLEFCMKIVISAAAKAAVGSGECNGSTMILDPENRTILSIAASSIHKHPMWHASMLAIDLIAKHQGGGTWKLINPIIDKEDDRIKRKCCNTIPLRYPDSLNEIEIPTNDNLIFSRKDEKKNKDSKSEVNEKCGPYLCTGYWAILLQEPCPLCAMALLHSRISRIFYGAANLQTGILGSKATLHSVPGLNHRYQVWSGVLEDECVRTLQKCQKVVN